MDDSAELLNAVNEIRELLRIIAEPAIAERDKKSRQELMRIVGSSMKKANAVLLMDGTRIQATIQKESGINQGDLSTLVKQLRSNKLLSENAKQPKLLISIPKNFFDDEVD